jgi:uncharacterized protein (DUF4415 family)
VRRAVASAARSLKLSKAERARARKRGQPADRAIDFSDIPDATDAELAQMVRAAIGRKPGRPPFGRAKRVLISVKVDPDVLAALRVRAAQRGIGYQTLINDVLATVVQS